MFRERCDVRKGWLAIFAIVTAPYGLLSTASAQDQAEVVTYDQVRSVFKKRCQACHGQDEARGDLDLSSVESIKAGSASGPVAIAGKAEESLVYTLAAHLEDPRMPPGAAKIPQRELELIRGWIDGGMQLRSGEGNVPPEQIASQTPAPGTPPKPSTPPKTSIVIEPLVGPTPITAMAASPTDGLFAIPGHHQVILLQTADQTPVRTFAFPEGDVFSLRFSQDGRTLLAGGGVGGLSGLVVAFNVETGERIFEIGDEADVVLAADVSPDGRFVALGGPKKSVKVFRVADKELVATLRKHTDWILSVAFSPDGLLLASSDRFGGLQIWEAESGKEFHTLRGHTGPVTSLSWMGSSERLLSGGEDGTLRIWDMHKGQTLQQWSGEIGGILSVATNKNGQIAAAGRNKQLAVWNAVGETPRVLSMTDEIGELVFAGDATRILAGDAAGHIAVFDPSTGDIAGMFEIPVSKVARVLKPRPAPVAHMPVQKKPEAAPQSEELAVAEADVARIQQELNATREALALTEKAIAPAEESIKTLRESAQKLKTVISGQEQAVHVAAKRVEEIRVRLASSGGPGIGDTTADLAHLETLLTEKKSLLESASAFAKQVEAAAARSPEDAGLKSAARLANELKAGLQSEVDAASQKLNGVTPRQAEVAGND